ncbi:hypothetical protein SESBI_00730 [Sesbania bispinosa]|nr:hypothetical protein SESBI_00730 [Sesbania bispinosa]
MAESKENSCSGDFVSHPPKLSDDGGQDQQTGVSFRDKVIGRQTSSPMQGKRDLIGTTSQVAGGGDSGGPLNPNSLHGTMQGIIEESMSGPKLQEDLHGDWLVVTRRKKPPKQKEKSAAASVPIKSGTQSNRYDKLFSSTDLRPEDSIIQGPNPQPLTFNAQLDTSLTYPKVWTRKCARRDSNDKKKAQPTLHNKNTDKPSTSFSPANIIPTNKEMGHPKPAPKTIMIGGTKVFDLGNGFKTTMNLKKTVDNQFTFQEDEEQDMVEDGAVIQLSPPGNDSRDSNKIVKEASDVDRGPPETAMLMDN